VGQSDTTDWVKVILSVGSNIDPDRNIPAARESLNSTDPANLRYLRSSPVVETEPRGFLDQPTFQNCAFLIETRLNIQALDQLLKKVEQDLGRERISYKDGPRTIDLDVVVWDGRVTDEDYERYDFVQKSVEHLLHSSDDE